jgi:hypothetical protein
MENMQQVTRKRLGIHLVARAAGAGDAGLGARTALRCACDSLHVSQQRTRGGLLSVLSVAAILFVAVPASAQIDFSGEWSPNGGEDSGGNPLVGDYLGLPLNEAGLARAEAWDASIQSIPEWQCRPHGWAYIYRGPTSMRIWKDVDPVSRDLIAYNIEWLQSDVHRVYMDGRPHPPPHAAHTWAGFSTGEWIGDMLKIRTTHIKENYIRRNGVQHSDLATVTTYLLRRDDVLTWINIVHDPVYLTEPLVRSGEFRRNPGQQMPAHPCTVVAEVDRPNDVVPHVLPGTNPFIAEFASRMQIPESVVWAGAESMYPEFRSRVRRSRD